MPASPRRRLGDDDVAAWLIKSALPLEELEESWVPGQTRQLRRCLRPSYRLRLMRAGQPCLLWVSGPGRAGVHAVGTLVEPASDDGPRPEVAVTLRRVPRPAYRAELLRLRGFADAEVVRMPAGSNPSYLTAAQLAAVRQLLHDEPWHPAG